MAKKTTVSEKDFKAFVKVQRSGRTNMFDVRTVGILSGLDRETIIAVMHEYDDLADLYPKVVA